LARGRIDVIAQREGEEIIIDVIDNGIGLPKVARQRLLEPYVTTRAKGTGLGLAIVGRVLEDHGGRIELKDASDFRPGQRGAWMRLHFAVTGHAQGAAKIHGRGQGAEGNSETRETTTETKQAEAETAEKAGTTNSDPTTEHTKIQAASGD
jgi:two-component system nitrogen regulation sensor histidine kinase NtrY